MPEAGRVETKYSEGDGPIVAGDSLPLFLRDYDFAARRAMPISLLPSQKSNRPTGSEPVNAVIHFVGEEADSYRLELRTNNGTVLGTYWMAKDRLHIMLRYEGFDGQRYELKSIERVNYWTIREK
jgi:hypothetical protein